jgi:hypothetical protein
MKIVFWNIQGMKNDECDELGEDCENLAEQFDPDVIILCEGKWGLEETLAARGFGEYGIISSTDTDYRDNNVLRYVVFGSHSAPEFDLKLIGGPRQAIANVAYSHARPMVLLTWSDGDRAVLAGHLPSVPQSTTPQFGAVAAALDDFRAEVARDTLSLSPVTPEALFGDLNVHLENSFKTHQFLDKLEKPWECSLVAQDPGKPTHWDGTNWTGTLDWLVCMEEVEEMYTVQTIEEQQIEEIALSGSATQLTQTPWPPQQRQQFWSSLDDSAMDEDSSIDLNYSPMWTNQKGSDHRPILVEIEELEE